MSDDGLSKIMSAAVDALHQSQIGVGDLDILTSCVADFIALQNIRQQQFTKDRHNRPAMPILPDLRTVTTLLERGAYTDAIQAASAIRTAMVPILKQARKQLDE
jgi:hypothetical protein